MIAWTNVSREPAGRAEESFCTPSRLALWERTQPSRSRLDVEELMTHLGGPRIIGVRKLDDVARIDLAEALRSLLTWEHRRALDELAPERVEVPSGSRIAVDYTDPAFPVR